MALYPSTLQDRFDLAETDVLIARDPGKPSARERANVESIIDAVIYLAPGWPGAREWIESAITAADTSDACSYIKLRGVIVSVLPHHHVDGPGNYANVYVTRNFDIYSLCEY
jgi:hypothetical protein